MSDPRGAPRPENDDGYSAPNVIELDDHTCMPGLMDMHVHIITETSPDRFVDRFRLEPADFAYSSIKYSKRTLEAGLLSSGTLEVPTTAISLKYRRAT